MARLRPMHCLRTRTADGSHEVPPQPEGNVDTDVGGHGDLTGAHAPIGRRGSSWEWLRLLLIAVRRASMSRPVHDPSLASDRHDQGVEGGVRGEVHAVSFRAAEGDVGDDLRYPDLADQRAVRVVSSAPRRRRPRPRAGRRRRGGCASPVGRRPSLSDRSGRRVRQSTERSRRHAAWLPAPRDAAVCQCGTRLRACTAQPSEYSAKEPATNATSSATLAVMV